MVYIKSSVLVAAAALSAASAMPTANFNVDVDVNSAVPSSTSTGNDGFNMADASAPTAVTTGKAVIDLNVDVPRVDVLEVRRQKAKDDETYEGGLRRSVKDMVQAVEKKGSAKKEKSGSMKFGGGGGQKDKEQGKRLWKGRPSRRGPWRNAVDDGNLIDLNIGHAATDAVHHDNGHLLGNGDLIDIATRSSRHDEGHDRVIFTGDHDDYYRNSGHGHRHTHGHGSGNVHEHIHAHGHSKRHHRHHSVVEVIGDDYRYHRGGRHGNVVEYIDDGYHRGHGNGDSHVHVHEHYGRRHRDDIEIVQEGHRHHGSGFVEVINDGQRHGSEEDHVHEHIHARSHRDHDDNVVVVNDDGHRHHGGDVTVIGNGRHRHGGEVTVVDNGRHRHGGDVNVVDNGRHSHGATTVVNSKRSPSASPSSSPKEGFSSKLAGLGRAFLKRHRGSDTTIVNNHGHSDTLVVTDSGRHRHGGDTTIVNSSDGWHHHGSDTVVVNNSDGHHRHGADTTIVNNSAGRHHRNGDTTVINSKRGHHRSDRIVVVGDDRRYQDADFFYRHSWDNGLRYGKPIYFSDGGAFNRVRVIGNYADAVTVPVPVNGYPYTKVAYGPVGYASDRYGRFGYPYGKREHDDHDHDADEHHEHDHDHHERAQEEGEDTLALERRRHDHDGDVTVIDKNHHGHGHRYHGHSHNSGDVTVVNNDGRNGHHGHGGDVTVVNNHKRRNHGHDDRHAHRGDHRHHSWSSDECRHGRCDSRDGGDVTVVNKHKRQDSSIPMNAMGGAPGYIDVTSPVYNSTTAQRIASLVLSTSNGTDPNSTFVLNASNNIRTQVYLVPLTPSNSTAASTAAASSNSTSSSPISVNLKVPIFVASSASVEPYCATFDPSPENPAPLTVTPCTNDTSSHESQKFLYNPNTGVIHPDWQPSTDAQQLLQAIPDDIDGDAPQSDMAAAMSTASATLAAAEAYATDGDFGAYSDSMTPTGAASASLARRATAAATTTTTMVPASSSASSSGLTSTGMSSSSSAAGSAPSTTFSPPPIQTDGPHTSTDSTALPQTSTASNVTLIFTPVNPSINQASIPVDSIDDSGAGGNSGDGSAQQATMTQMNRRSRFFSPDINQQAATQAQGDNASSQSTGSADLQTADISGGGNSVPTDHSEMNVNADSNMNAPSAPAPSSADSSAQDTGSAPQSSSNGNGNSNGVNNGIHASANVKANGPVISAFRGDSVLQKPMAAPESLTAPYQ
ncbi:hypothetical protein I317_07462 [Kwoniella heveanensis CBS 569]|nr:hypothetical protein I317_07462 [Kwoniella heveanensis CBS 569]